MAVTGQICQPRRWNQSLKPKPPLPHTTVLKKHPPLTTFNPDLNQQPAKAASLAKTNFDLFIPFRKESAHLVGVWEIVADRLVSGRKAAPTIVKWKSICGIHENLPARRWGLGPMGIQLFSFFAVVANRVRIFCTIQISPTIGQSLSVLVNVNQKKYANAEAQLKKQPKFRLNTAFVRRACRSRKRLCE